MTGAARPMRPAPSVQPRRHCRCAATARPCRAAPPRRSVWGHVGRGAGCRGGIGSWAEHATMSARRASGAVGQIVVQNVVQEWPDFRPKPHDVVPEGRLTLDIVVVLLENGGLERIRTPDPLIRSQVLYPTELPVRRVWAEIAPPAGICNPHIARYSAASRTLSAALGK